MQDIVQSTPTRRSALMWLSSILGLVGCTTSAEKTRANSFNVERYDVSPDGRLMLLEFMHPKQGWQTALYDLRTEKLTVLKVSVPETNGGPIARARFMPDGKNLLALSVRKLDKDDYGAYDAHLVKVNIADQSVTRLAHLPSIEVSRPDPSRGFASYVYWDNPTMQPGTNKVLFVMHYFIERYLNEFDLSTGKFRTVLDYENNGFRGMLAKPYFVGPDEVVFTGMTPRNAEIKKLAESIGLGNTALTSYRFKFGNSLKLVMPTTKAEVESRFDVRSASLDGKRYLMLGLSQTEPYNERRQFNWEIFTLTEGKLKQHTRMRSHMGGAAMSADGTTAIFQARFSREGARDTGHEFYAIDLQTDQVVHLRVLEQLRQHVEQISL